MLMLYEQVTKMNTHCWIFLLYFVSLDVVLGRTRIIRNVYNQKCTSRLESALDTTLRRTQQRSGFGSLIDFSETGTQRQSLFNRSPHNTYEEDVEQIVSEYKQKYNSHKQTHGNKESFFPPSGMTSTSQVEVANLKVRIPHKLQWVVVDRCHFIEKNRTLDTKLEFPDLQISGRVIMHPGGGKCDMILRLRKAGIEFRTVPLIPSGANGKSRQANVRTDSHFSEPGFISIFAHSCEGPTGIKYRINSKRRHFIKKHQPAANYDAFYKRDYSSEYQQNLQRKRSIDLLEDEDLVGEDVLKLTDADSLLTAPSMFVDVAKEELSQTATPSPFNGDSNSRTLYSERSPFAYNAYAGNGAGWQTVETNDALDEAYSNEIDNLFSKGVRGLLTTYMQKALQPAIKETLMESMGYTLSYG